MKSEEHGSGIFYFPIEVDAKVWGVKCLHRHQPKTWIAKKQSDKAPQHSE